MAVAVPLSRCGVNGMTRVSHVTSDQITLFHIGQEARTYLDGVHAQLVARPVEAGVEAALHEVVQEFGVRDTAQAIVDLGARDAPGVLCPAAASGVAPLALCGLGGGRGGLRGLRGGLRGLGLGGLVG